MTLLTLNMTWRIAVPWKNGAAPRVTPGMRVVMVMSDCDERVEIWMQVSNSGETRLVWPYGPWTTPAKGSHLY